MMTGREGIESRVRGEFKRATREEPPNAFRQVLKRKDVSKPDLPD